MLLALLHVAKVADQNVLEIDGDDSEVLRILEGYAENKDLVIDCGYGKLYKP